MKNKIDFKKALKALAKTVGKDVIFYQSIDNGRMTLVSEGHIIISVPTEQFDELKYECFPSKKFKLAENDMLVKVFESTTLTPVRYTTLKFAINDTIPLVAVFKAHYNGETVLGAVNQKYIDIVNLTLHGDYIYGGFNVINLNSDRIKTPIIATDYDENGKLTCGTAILPVNFDIKSTIEHVME